LQHIIPLCPKINRVSAAMLTRIVESGDIISQ
jgi:hypothetical protein